MKARTTTLLAVLFAVALVAVSRASTAADSAAAPVRHKYDLWDLEMMSDTTRATFERGESLLLSGDLVAALPLLEQAANETQRGAMASRRLVETYAALGRRDDAIATCYATLRRRSSAMDLRACVRAFTSGTGPISPNDMYLAVTYARHAVDASPDLPFGYAAQCDIANRIGDVDMLNECTKQLERVAPGHAETRRAIAMVAAARHPFRIAAAWIMLGLACVGTLVHAWLRARGRHTARAGAVALGSGVFCLVFALSQPAHADSVANEAPPQGSAPAQGSPAASAEAPADRPNPGHFSKFEINENDPLSSVPDKAKLDANPLQFGYLVMDLTEGAEQAEQRGDRQAALRYWQALAKATPDRSYAFMKMCETYEALGRWDAAVYSCGAVLERTGTTLKDYTRYVGIVLSKKGDLNSNELAALDTVLAHMAKDATGKGAVDELACRIGARTWDANRLGPCTASLTAQAPNHPNTVYFQWALAVSRGNTEAARSLLGRAREVSIKPDELRFMEKETNRLGKRWVNYLGITAGLVVVLASAAGLFLVLRRRSTKAPEASAPSGATA